MGVDEYGSGRLGGGRVWEWSSDKNARTFIAECIKEIKSSVIGNDTLGSWRRVFPSNSREIVFKDSANCTYYALIDIIQKHRIDTCTVEKV